MRRLLPYLAAIGLILGSGAVSGVWTERWRPSSAIQEAVARLEKVPMNVGDWQGRPSELDRRQLEAGNISGHLLRTYVNRKTGEELTTLVVCGRPGPISVHTPDICYQGAGYALERSPERVTVAADGSAGAGEFFRGDFLKTTGAVPSGLRILWSWNGGGGWRAAENPRLAHAASGALYKLYVVRQFSGGGPTRVGDDVGIEFLRAWLPAADAALVPKG